MKALAGSQGAFFAEKFCKKGVQFHLKLNVVRDATIISKLRSQPSIQGYIKRLVEEDVRRETPE